MNPFAGASAANNVSYWANDVRIERLHDHTLLARFDCPAAELPGDAGAIGEHDPGALIRTAGRCVCRRRWRLSDEQGLRCPGVSGRFTARQRRRVLEPDVAEQAHPGLAGQQRVSLTGSVVASQPPPFGHSECDVEPSQLPDRLDDHRHAAWREELSHVRERGAQVRRRMQHVGREHEIEPRRESLRRRIQSNVEQPVVDERILPEPLLGARREHRRHIGEDVARPTLREKGEHTACQGAGAGAHLQDAERPPGRQPGERGRCSLADDAGEQPHSGGLRIHSLGEPEQSSRK